MSLKLGVVLGSNPGKGLLFPCCEGVLVLDVFLGVVFLQHVLLLALCFHSDREQSLKTLIASERDGCHTNIYKYTSIYLSTYSRQCPYKPSVYSSTLTFPSSRDRDTAHTRHCGAHTASDRLTPRIDHVRTVRHPSRPRGGGYSCESSVMVYLCLPYSWPLGPLPPYTPTTHPPHDSTVSTTWRRTYRVRTSGRGTTISRVGN